MKDQQILQVIQTNDGSSSLYHEALDETYHSRHGARIEAEHVFIGNGLKEVIGSGQNSIKIFEVGFGTGLNCLLTALAIENLDNIKISYHSLEKFPLGPKIIDNLNYSKINEELFAGIHQCNWDEEVEINSRFQLKKIQGDLLKYQMMENSYDLIYYDAFGPRAQEEMWHIDNFKNCYRSLKNGGVFVTYCAKGQVRRDLQSIGFEMERLQGPPGKREMLRATRRVL